MSIREIFRGFLFGSQQAEAFGSQVKEDGILPRVGPGQGIDLGKERCKIGAI